MSYMEQDVLDLERALEESRDPETGELKEEDLLAFDELVKTDIAPKMDKIMWVIRKKEAMSNMLKEQKKVLEERIKQAEKDIEHLEKRVLFGLNIVSDNNKLETDSFKYSTRKSKSVEIQEGAIIPEEYMVEKVTYSPDKKLLKEHLESGVVIPGIEIKEKINLSVK